MKKNQVFGIAFSISITVLALQWWFLSTLLQKEQKEEKLDLTNIFISKVMKHSFKHDFPLFLIDPTMFQRAHSNRPEDYKDCHFLCPTQKVVHFGTIGPLSSQMQKNAFIEAVEEDNFKIMQFTGPDPVLQQHELNSPIPFHYVITDQNVAIHVAVFYERPAKFWWTGGYRLNDKELRNLYEMNFKKEDLRMLKHSSAYEK